MKSKLLTGILSLLMLSSCEIMSLNDDYNELENRLDRIESKMDSLENKVNSDVKALMTIVNAYTQMDYITSVETEYDKGNPVGYKIFFLHSGEVIIHNGNDGRNGIDGTDGKDGTDGVDGKDGYSPIIGVMQGNDGLWYWTLDGEWLTDERGDRICLNTVKGESGSDGSNGICPLMKIDNGMWYISTDGGLTWTAYLYATGPDGASGKDGMTVDDIFEEIVFDENNAMFILNSGTIITIPLYKPFALTLSCPEEMSASPGDTLYVEFKLSGYTGNITVSAISGNGWISVVEMVSEFEGRVKIVVPNPFCAGKVTILASDEAGNMRVRSIVFTECITE